MSLVELKIVFRYGHVHLSTDQLKFHDILPPSEHLRVSDLTFWLKKRTIFQLTVKIHGFHRLKRHQTVVQFSTDEILQLNNYATA